MAEGRGRGDERVGRDTSGRRNGRQTGSKRPRTQGGSARPAPKKGDMPEKGARSGAPVRTQPAKAGGAEKKK